MKDIRKMIEDRYEWNATLTGFECQIGEVEFDENNGYIHIYPKGTEHFYENQLTTLTMTCIESVVAFMQGSLFIGCQNGKAKMISKKEI